MWRNGIYAYPHYHSMIHESLGVARGRAKVRFGGAQGRDLDIASGEWWFCRRGPGTSACGRRPSWS